MKTLIAAMTFIQRPEQRDMLIAWLNLATRLNPGVDLLLVDSASPIGPLSFLPDGWNIHHLAHDDDTPKQETPRLFARFGNSLGHPSYDSIGAGCGSDRAWMKIFEIGIASGYDRLAYIEADIMLRHPVEKIFASMTKPLACGPLVPEHSAFPDTGLFFAQPLSRLVELDFIARYNWRGPTYPEGEARARDILGADMEMLPFRGGKDRWLTAPDRIAAHYPRGIDYLTHAHPETLREFLRGYDLLECWPT